MAVAADSPLTAISSTRVVSRVFGSGGRERSMAVFVLLATAALHFPSVLSPNLIFDDFVIFQDSWDAATTIRNLWKPHNEHAMPLGRLAAWALLAIDSRVVTLPARAALQGPLAVTLAAGLIYWFVRRELDRPLAALLAALLFGVSLKYREVVTWYAASFWLLGLDTLLLALLAAQSWRRTGRIGYLVLTVLACFLAPGWYAGGILAGSLCVLYLLPQPVGGVAGWRGRAWALVPALGSALFLAVSLPQNAQQIVHAEHYGERTLWQVFDPWFGLVCTGRATVDILFFNPKGLGGSTCPPIQALLILIALAAVCIWWNWRAPPRLALLGLGLIVGHYLLTFSARSGWSYEGGMANWTRYHLVPWFGMVLIAVNGLSHRAMAAAKAGGLGWWQTAALAGLTILLFAQHFSWQSLVPSANVEQQDVLRRVTEMDERCRAYGISAGDARAVLEPLDMPLSGDALQKNAWNWLRGSDRPQERPLAEVRQLLTE